MSGSLCIECYLLSLSLWASIERALPVRASRGLDLLSDGGRRRRAERDGGDAVLADSGAVSAAAAAAAGGGGDGAVLGDVDHDGGLGDALAQHVDLLRGVELVLLACNK